MDKQQLVEILRELRSASMSLGPEPSEYSLKSLMQKYNMLFVGEKFNVIYSRELCHALKNYFCVEISNDDLNKLLPGACKSLNMQLEPLIEISKIGKSSTPDCYQITLW